MKKSVLLLFEDEFVVNLFPLTLTRPVYDLRSGILTIREKIVGQFPDRPLILHSRDYLEETLRNKNAGNLINKIPDDVNELLLINGAILPEENLHELFEPDNGKEEIFVREGRLVAAKIKGESIDLLKQNLNSFVSTKLFENLTTNETAVKLITYPWELVNNNGHQIELDFKKLVNKGANNIKGEVYEGVHLINKELIFIDEGAVLKPGVVIDAEEGPVYIGKDAVLFPNVVIEGPCYIGNKSKIKTGAKIYENTSIGPVCKVGGEVEESIIHSYSNKQHDGFLGHAYLGQWVNLGADTNNSDLKNNYGNVRVYINDEPVESGSMFVGLTMGDHSKSAINTMFNTGTVVGVCSNVFGAGFPEKYIPSFTWGFGSNMKIYKLEKSFEVAAKVMARRNIEFTEADKDLFKKIFELTKKEREKRKLTE